MTIHKKGWVFKSVAMLCVFGMGSTALAPEARAMGPIRAGMDWAEAHQVTVNCVSAGISIAMGGMPIVRGYKCIVGILASFGIGGGGHKGVAGSSQRSRQPIEFRSIEEFLAHPKVSKEDKDLVRSQYLPAIKNLESEITNKVNQSLAASKSKNPNIGAITAKVAQDLQPSISRAKAPLEAKGIKVIVNIK